MLSAKIKSAITLKILAPMRYPDFFPESSQTIQKPIANDPGNMNAVHSQTSVYPNPLTTNTLRNNVSDKMINVTAGIRSIDRSDLFFEISHTPNRNAPGYKINTGHR